MTELRIDPFTRRRVLLAPGRAARPSSFSLQESEGSEREDCPFCEGREDQTPKELWALRDGSPDTPGWQIRVVPNKYPLSGAHEIIIESPRHDMDIPDFALDQVERVIMAYCTRMRSLSRQQRLRYIALFKNHGRSAGASCAHAHAQLVGLHFVPPLVREELQMAGRYYHQHGQCLYCDTIEREIDLAERVIDFDQHYLVWSPPAARAPYEFWILPRRHLHDFRTVSSEEIAALARTLQSTLQRTRRALHASDVAYNYWLHTASLPSATRTRSLGSKCSYHWHMEILPRLSTLAGLEWGTDLYVQSVTPEEAARALRSA